MPLLTVPDNVFTDMVLLRQTYRRLEQQATLPRPRGRGVLKRPSQEQRQRIRDAKSTLEWLNNQLLRSISPELFQQLLIHEVAADSPLSEVIVTPHILRQSGSSLAQAKRVAHLFVHVTLFHSRSPENSEREEVPCALLHMCFMARFLHKQRIFVNPKIIPQGFDWIERLIEGAVARDNEAYFYLRLLYHALVDWCFDLQPIRQGEYTQRHWDECVGALEGRRERDGRREIVATPVPYSDRHWGMLNQARLDHTTWLRESAGVLNTFLDRLKLIPIEFYEQHASNLWARISGEGRPHLVLSNGQDKVEVLIPGLRTTNLCSLAFVREHPTVAGQWRSYPEIGVNLFWEMLCEHRVSQVTITSAGEMQGFNIPTWPPHLTMFLLCLILDAYAQIVVPHPQHPPSPSGGTRVRRNHHHQGSRVPVHPHFRRLAAGRRASQEQIDRSVQATGHPPPAGYTFVDEFQREFPGYVPPAQVQTDLWHAHKRLRPVLVYDADVSDMLLDEIRSSTSSE